MFTWPINGNVYMKMKEKHFKDIVETFIDRYILHNPETSLEEFDICEYVEATLQDAIETLELFEQCGQRQDK